MEEYFDALTKLWGINRFKRYMVNCGMSIARLAVIIGFYPISFHHAFTTKCKMQRTQTLLERWAEPWSALSWLEGEDYPKAFLWKSWEWLLQNHPHDSIGGCSIDAVHAQMETRFAWASEIAEEITRERFELLTRRIDLIRSERR